MSTVLKNSILKEINAISFDTSANDVNMDRSIVAITTGINNYILNEHSFSLQQTVGIIINPLPATPTQVKEPLTASLFTSTHSLDTFQTFWNTIVRNGLPENGIQRIFQAISSYLMTPPYQVTLDVGGGQVTTLIPPSPTPLVPVVFPTMVIQGITCQNQIQNTTFKDLNGEEAKDKFWEIMTNHIHIALTANVIPPIPTAGLNIAGLPYTGITTCILTFN